jgi:hypothetical protein
MIRMMVTSHQMSQLRVALIVVAYAAGLPSVAAAQDHWLRDRVREQGDLALGSVISCGPPVGLKEIVEHTQLTVEGVVSRADSVLMPGEMDLYTDYVIDVTRVFRMPPAVSSRRTPGATEVSPFVAAAPVSRPGASAVQVRVRALYHGRLELEGGVVTQGTGFRMLAPGEHVIVSASFNRDVGQWLPFGVFTVRDGRVIHLQLQLADYETVAEFASALANPPPTPQR